MVTIHAWCSTGLIISLVCIQTWCIATTLDGLNNDASFECGYDTASGTKVCDCEFRNEHLTLPEMTGKVHRIHVTNCRNIYVKNGTFFNMAFVSTIVFSNIESLVLDKYSLEFQEQHPLNKLRLQFENVTFAQISSHSIRGVVDRIEFKNCVIKSIRPFAIGVADPLAYLISMDSTIIHKLESQAFKNIAVERFELKNSAIIADIPSRAFFDLDIREQFLMTNCTLTNLQPGAFSTNKIRRFNLRNNSIESIGEEALNIVIGESISFEQNVINHLYRRSFVSITVSNQYKQSHSEPLEWILKTTSVKDQQRPFGLIFSDDFRIALSDLNYMTTVTCDEADTIRNNFFLRTHANTIHFEFLTGGRNPDTNEHIHQPISVAEIMRERCLPESTIYVSLIAVFITLTILVLACGFVAYKYIRARRKLNELDIVAPDGKTYRETQIIFQVQNVGLLKTDL